MTITDINFHKHRNLILAFAEGTAKSEDAVPLLKDAFGYPEFTVWSTEELGDYLTNHYKLNEKEIKDFMHNCPIHIPEGKDQLNTHMPMPTFDKDSAQVTEILNSFLAARHSLQQLMRHISSTATFPGNFKDQEQFYQAMNERLKVNDWICQLNKFIDLQIENCDQFITEKQ